MVVWVGREWDLVHRWKKYTSKVIDDMFMRILNVKWEINVHNQNLNGPSSKSILFIGTSEFVLLSSINCRKRGSCVQMEFQRVEDRQRERLQLNDKMMRWKTCFIVFRWSSLLFGKYVDQRTGPVDGGCDELFVRSVIASYCHCQSYSVIETIYSWI